jgi:hypothetical protein
MSYSFSTTDTWSRTHARKVGGKLVADLRQMQQEYGLPTDQRLDEYLIELIVLLAGGYLRDVTYGFRRNSAWIAALRYTADMNGNLTADDRSGSVPRGEDITGATWGSFLNKSAKWDELSASARAAIENELPFSRAEASEPTAGAPVRTGDKTYSSAGCGVLRSTIGGTW